MTRGTGSPLLREVSRLAGLARLADDELLDRFAAGRDEAAFAELVRRHGARVLRACRHALGDAHDAEDASQATFLVLARKAAALRGVRSLAGWLHGTAVRTAQNARRVAMRRRRRERAAARPDGSPPPDPAPLRDLQAILDEEIARLPEKYRTPFVLCFLDGRGRAEAAADLGWPEGTVGSRVARAREILQRRLTARGVSLSTALAAHAMSPAAVGAVDPAAVARGATAYLGGAVGPASALANAVVRGLFVARVKAVALVLALAVGAAGVVGGGVTVLTRTAAPAPEPPAVVAPEPDAPGPDLVQAPPPPRPEVRPDELTVADPAVREKWRRVDATARALVGPAERDRLYRLVGDGDGPRVYQLRWMSTDAGRPADPDRLGRGIRVEAVTDAVDPRVVRGFDLFASWVPKTGWGAWVKYTTHGGTAPAGEAFDLCVYHDTHNRTARTAAEKWALYLGNASVGATRKRDGTAFRVQVAASTPGGARDPDALRFLASATAFRTAALAELDDLEARARAEVPTARPGVRVRRPAVGLLNGNPRMEVEPGDDPALTPAEAADVLAELLAEIGRRRQLIQDHFGAMHAAAVRAFPLAECLAPNQP